MKKIGNVPEKELNEEGRKHSRLSDQKMSGFRNMKPKITKIYANSPNLKNSNIFLKFRQ